MCTYYVEGAPVKTLGRCTFVTLPLKFEEASCTEKSRDIMREDMIGRAAIKCANSGLTAIARDRE